MNGHIGTSIYGCILVEFFSAKYIKQSDTSFSDSV